MRITEAGLRKIVREMLKEAAAGAEDDQYAADLAAWQAKTLEAKAANDKKIAANLSSPLTLAANPASAQPPAPQTPTAAPTARQPRGNPTVMQVQKIIGAPQDGFWGQQTQTQFMNFVKSKINGGVKVTGINDVNALSNWKNVAGQIRLVGVIPTPKGFAPNIDGLIRFISILNSNEVANQAVESLTQPDQNGAEPWEEELENEYFAWNQPNNPKNANAYFPPSGVNNTSNAATNLAQPVSNPASAGRGVFKRRSRKK